MTYFGSRLIACCKLAPTLARQMWRHNYVINRNEYIIFTLSESVNPSVYSLQFLFKSINNSWRYERKCEWVFFFWTQCITFSYWPNFANSVLNMGGAVGTAWYGSCSFESGTANQSFAVNVPYLCLLFAFAWNFFSSFARKSLKLLIQDIRF